MIVDVIKRKKAILDNLSKFKLDSLLITNIANVRYASGFTGTAGVVLLSGNSSYFLTDFRYKQQVAEQVTDYTHVVKPSMLECMKNLDLLDREVRIGFEADHLPVARLDEYGKNFPKVEWIPTNLVVERAAAIKDEHEIASIGAACRIVDEVFTEIIGMMEAGVTERDVSAEISYRTMKHGSEVDPFEPIVASGERSALPHGISSVKEIEQGDLVVLDFGATVNGYAADMTRTVVMGKPAARQSEIYAVVLDAQAAAIDAARHGITGAELDAVARDLIAARGYGEQFGHSLGHGLGLEVHSWPRVSSANKEPLLAGMAVTIEPGVYISNFGGVRIEDNVVLTGDGCINLTGSPKTLLSVG